MAYVNLHCHSVYSIGDALPEPIEIAEKNKELGNEAFCITDHGNMGCWIAAYKAQESTGLKFIPGCEFYIKPDEDLWKKTSDSEDARRYYHLLVLAKNQAGVKNLIRIYNSGEEMYSKVLIDKESLFKNKEGLIVANACVSGEILTLINQGHVERAKEKLIEFKKEFGDDFYVELQWHDLTFMDELKAYNTLVGLAKELGIKMIATTDSHYVNKEDSIQHDIFKNIYLKRPFNFKEGKFDPGFDGNGYYIKDEDEIIESISHITALTPEEVKEVVNNSMEIVNKCERTDFPRAKPLSDKSKILREEVMKGWEKKRKGTDLAQTSLDRIEEELSVIEQKDFTEYFINVLTIVDRAKQNGVLVGPGRGCFLPGTKVTTSEGMKNIEDVKRGEKVLSGDMNFYNVDGTHIYDVDEPCVTLSLSSGEKINCTPDHEFFINGEWVKAEDIPLGSSFTTQTDN